MKKLIAILLAVLILVSCLAMAGCGAEVQEEKTETTCKACGGSGMFVNEWNQKSECPTCDGDGKIVK